MRDAGMRVSIFLHTFESGCPEQDRQLVATLNPVEYAIVPRGSTARIVDSYLQVLRMVRQSSEDPEQLLLLRFDLVIRRPFFSLPIDWGKINLPWRAEQWQWDVNHATSDLFYVLPARMSDSLAAALEWSGNQQSGDSATWGAAHWIYDPLCADAKVGRQSINFIEGGNFYSTIDVEHASDSNGPDNLFLAILRECPPVPWCH